MQLTRDENVTFSLAADDLCRLLVNGVPIIPSAGSGGRTAAATLRAGINSFVL